MFGNCFLALVVAASIWSQGTSSQAAENSDRSRFVTGHDFSRAANAFKSTRTSALLSLASPLSPS